MTFRKEFNKQMLVFITGAFSFMAALVWNNAMQKIINDYEPEITNNMPFKNPYIVDVSFALVVTIVAVLAIIIVSRLLKVD